MQLGRAAEVDGGRGHQPDPGVPVVMVVPPEELAAVGAGVLDVVEPLGELGPVLQGLEVRLRVGVVAGGVRATVRLDDAEVGEEERQWLGAHRAAAVGVQGQHLGGDLLLLGRLLDQRLGELRVLAVLHGPADDVATEHVEDHVQVEPGPLRWALISFEMSQLQSSFGRSASSSGFVYGCVGELIAPLPHAAVVRLEDPVRRPVEHR